MQSIKFETYSGTEDKNRYVMFNDKRCPKISWKRTATSEKAAMNYLKPTWKNVITSVDVYI